MDSLKNHSFFIEYSIGGVNFLLCTFMPFVLLFDLSEYREFASSSQAILIVLIVPLSIAVGIIVDTIAHYFFKIIESLPLLGEYLKPQARKGSYDWTRELNTVELVQEIRHRTSRSRVARLFALGTLAFPIAYTFFGGRELSVLIFSLCVFLASALAAFRQHRLRNIITAMSK